MARGALPAARGARDEHRAPDARRPRQRSMLRHADVGHGELRRAHGEALRDRVPALRRESKRGAAARLHAVSPTGFNVTGRSSAKVAVMRNVLVAAGWGWATAIVWLSLTPSPRELDIAYGDKLGHIA